MEGLSHAVSASSKEVAKDISKMKPKNTSWKVQVNLSQEVRNIFIQETEFTESDLQSSSDFIRNLLVHYMLTKEEKTSPLPPDFGVKSTNAWFKKKKWKKKGKKNS